MPKACLQEKKNEDGSFGKEKGGRRCQTGGLERDGDVKRKTITSVKKKRIRKGKKRKEWGYHHAESRDP